MDRLIGLALLAVFMAVRIADPGPLEMLRLKTFDFYQQFKPRPLLPNSPVVIVDIDEESLTEVGQWPWPRTQVAQVVENLVAMGAGVIGFDVFFVEEDRLSGKNLAESLPGLDDETRNRIRSIPGNDEIFAKVIKASRRVVLGQAVITEESEDVVRKPLPSRVVERGRKGVPMPGVWVPQALRILRNNEIIEKAGAGHGMVTILPEPDGVTRRVPAFIKKGKKLYPTLGLEMLRIAARRPSIQVYGDVAGISKVLVAKGVNVITDNVGRMWPYFSKTDKKKYVSIMDVLSGVVDPAAIKNKFVLIGTSAEGLKDIKTVPTERFIPGVEVHAQLIETILTKSYLIRPNWSNAAEMALALFGGLLIIILVPWIGAKWTLLFFLAVAGGTGGTSWYLFSQDRMIFDAAFAILAILTLYVTLTYTGYAKEEAQRRQTRDAFSKYLSPAMVEKVAGDPGQLKLGGDKRELTLLFCDVRGFTTISEQFDAVGLTALINKLLTPLTNVILNTQGTVDKYMGDCIMAFWNAPLDDENHCYNGCISALGMLAEIKPLNERLEVEAKEEGRKHIDLKVGLGLNSGECVVGNMGSDQRFDYSVLGDNVNLASRLEGQCKTYVVDIVIGENTLAHVEGLATLELDLIKVKGKTEAVRIFTLLGDETMKAGNAYQSLSGTHQELLDNYRGQDWAQAREKIAACRQLMDGFELGGLYDVFAERIDEYEANPPGSDWDGVYEATSK